MKQSIRVENLELKLDYFALNLGLEEAVPLPVGVFGRDDRLRSDYVKGLVKGVCRSNMLVIKSFAQYESYTFIE